MSSPVYRIHEMLSPLLEGVRVGTNRNLFLLLWTLISGRFLASRGGVFPALADFGLSDDVVRRAEATLNTGCWEIGPLIGNFERQVEEEGVFEAHSYGGYTPVAGDFTGFYRPCLKDCPTKHYCAEANKARPAIRLGLLARVGSVGTQRWAQPMAWVRAEEGDPSEPAHRKRLLEEAKARLADKEVLVLDGGFPLAQILEVGIQRSVSRLPTNFTARRPDPPAYQGHGPYPKRREVVRPLPRRYKRRKAVGYHEIAATPPDRTETWTETVGGKEIRLRAEFWDDLVLRETKEAEPVRFRVVAIYDPRFAEPLLLATRLDLSGADLRALYLDRWPIEGLPLAAKVILGTGRQFVFGKESRQRLPELALLAGAVLSYLAATEPVCATGFWDRKPKPTAGRLRRVLSRVHYANLGEIPAELRKKDSPTAHLPKGVAAHRRRKPSESVPKALPLAA
jgi:hypothetical protein